MDATATTRKRRRRLEPALDRRFEAVLFDWEGTGVADRARATELRDVIEQLCELGLVLGLIATADVGDVDGRLDARPRGPGRLYLCTGRGSEVSIVDSDGVRAVHERRATAEEKAALEAAANATITELERRGLRLDASSDPPGRRTIDLVPGVERADEPRAGRSALLEEVDARLRAASIAGLRGAVAIAKAAALSTGLPNAHVTTDGRHLEIGLTDKSDSVRWLFAELAMRGIGPGLAAIAGGELGPVGGMPGSDSLLVVPEAERATAVSVGAEPAGVLAAVIPLGGGPERFLDLLADQLERRRRRDVPDVDRDPAWTLVVRGIDARLERVRESMLTIADGRYGTRGAPLFAHPAAEPGVFAGDVYVGAGPQARLARAPVWTALDTPPPKRPRLERILDLRTGTLRHSGPVDALAFSSLASPGTVALRAQGDPRLLPQGQRRIIEQESVVAALADERADDRLERLGGLAPTEQAATDLLAAAERTGYEGLLAEHRARWAARWDQADVVVEGDPQLQSAIRLALFHLMASVADTGEAAVGARGLSGPGYRGHVFWDSDVFVLPFLAATHPAAARAMLEYRVRRLPQAREAAARSGRHGARFPWEGAADGFDVTPSHMELPTGEVLRVRTGEYEEHIVADVAWAAACYLDWTGDEAFAAGPARELFVETARYWASRIRVDGEGKAHIFGVIGPDEYHELVDDNVYTNVMARWNLRRGAESVADRSEREHWLRLADALVDGYDPASGVYEQFAGFYRLEPLVVADVAPRRPIAADLLLGRDRTSAAQVVKQADVLMLHHLVPDEVEPGSLLPNLDFYEPRTAHGSSLSPAIHASLHARAGQFGDALAALRLAARIDLDDLTGTTASGVHLATMGGLWQALAFGFAGIRVRGDRLTVEPRLPAEWTALEVRLRFRGSPLRLRIAGGGVELESRELALKRVGQTWEVSPR
jgi:trehalose/maltose hydrolase-like predicted phosphorylase